MKELVEVQCLYCQIWVKIPKIKGFRFVRWPVIHEDCKKAIADLKINKK